MKVQEQAKRYLEIASTMERIKKVWQENPDLRLGQLMHWAGKNSGADPIYPLFHTEDEALTEEIEKIGVVNTGEIA